MRTYYYVGFELVHMEHSGSERARLQIARRAASGYASAPKVHTISHKEAERPVFILPFYGIAHTFFERFETLIAAFGKKART